MIGEVFHRLKYKKLSGLVIFFALFNSVNHIAVSQCPSVDFNTPLSVCKEENVQISGIPTGYTEYSWDFCSGDLKSALSPGDEETLNTITNGFEIYHNTVVKGDDGWHIFYTSKGSNKLIRVDYGASLRNAPQSVVDLGNPNNLLSQPEAIKFVKYNEEWQALVSNRTGNKLIALNFGTSLTNIPTAIVVANTSFLGEVRALDVKMDNENIVAVVLDNANQELSMLNFGNSLTNTLDHTENIITVAVGQLNLYGISLIKSCDKWFGLILSSQFSGKVIKVSFGSSLFSVPTFTNISANFSTINNPNAVKLVKEAGIYYAFIITISGNLYKLDFGKSFLSDTPIVTNYGNFGILNLTYALDLALDQSKWTIYTIRYNSRAVYRVKFPDNCGANPPVSKLQYPDISYSLSGEYEISLTITDSEDSDSTAVHDISVENFTAPDIDFTSQNICLTSPIIFSYINTSDNINSYNWDFGDTNTSTAANPSHTYSSAGNYTVTLSVTSSDGCENFTQKNITIYPEPAPSFNLPSGTICTNDTYLFENTTPGEYEGNINYEWFVNGASVATTEDLSYEFPTGGAKEIKLIATIPGCSVETVQNIANVSVGPVAQFTVNDDCVGKALQFNNTSTGDIVSTHWDFGNGFTSNLENPLFQYAAPGTYDVTLTLTNSAGCTTSKVNEVNVYELPDVQFINDLSCEGTPTAFTDETTVGDANVTSWNWNFDDPTSGNNTSSDKNPTHTFTTSGAFDVKLVAQTTNGCKDSLQRVVNVKPAPVADFEYDRLCINETVQFVDTSEPVSGEDITAWSWDLGGVFSAEQNPETTFQFAVDYNVGLTVTSENLCTSTTYKMVSVKPAPSVTFGVEQACNNADVHFFDTTDPLGDPITSRSWNFAGQATGGDSSIYHAFNAVGNYEVSLTIMTENGCDYSVTEPIQIYEAPTAAFKPSVTFGAPPLDVEFTNNSVGANSFQWTFEEGSTSDDNNPVHKFTEEGSYEVELIATDENGCNDTTTHRINVLFPDLDIVLTALNRNPVDETEVILTVGNNGTVTIDSFKAAIDLGNQAVIEKVIMQTLEPRTSEGAQVPSVNINLGFNIDPQSLDYLCVTLIPLFEGLEENDIANNTKCINLNDNPTIILAPYPNPASNQLHLQIISKNKNAATLQLFDSKGDLVKDIEFEALSAGMNNLLINTGDIKQGIYMLKVSSGGKSSMYKVIIEN